MPSFLSKLLGKKKHVDNSDLLDGERYEAVPADIPPAPTLPENSQSPKSPPHKSKSHGLGLNLRRRAASPPPPPEHDTTAPAPVIPPSLPSLDLPTTKPEIKEDAGLDLRLKGLTDQILNDEDLRKKRLTPAETLYLVQKTAEVISERGLEVLGVMRPHWFASPNHHEAQLKLLNCFFQSLSVRSSNEMGPSSSSEDPFENELRYTRDPHDVAAVFRWGLRHLQLENDTFALSTIQDWYETFAKSERSEGYPPQAFDQILSPLLPNIHVQLIRAVLDVITSLAAHSEMNGISGNKLSKVLGWWIVSSRTVKESEWPSFYADWDGAARKFEHLFLAYIRTQASHSQMPRRLIELVKSYPFEKYSRPDDGIFLPRTRLSTRTTDALFIRIAVQTNSNATIHPLRIITDSLNSLPATDVSGDYLAIWEYIREAAKANTDEDKGDSRKFNLSAVFADESLRLLSLVPGMGDLPDVSFFPARSNYQRSFSLVERPLSLISNGDQRSTTDKAQSPSMTNLDLDHVTDWQAFSTTGFRSPSGISLTASLWDNDVEITTPPIRRNGTKHTLSFGSTSEPREEPAATTQPAAPTTEQVASPVESSPSHVTFSSPSLVKLDEAFVDFWADTLLDSVAQSWPAFVVCQLKPMSNLKVKDSDKSIEWMVIERVVVAPDVPPKQEEAEAEQPLPVPSTPPKADSSKSHGFFSSLASPGRKRWSLFSSRHETAPVKRERSRGKSGSKVGEMGEILKEEDETPSASSDASVTAPLPPPKESDISTTKPESLQEAPKSDEAVSQAQPRAEQLTPIPEETKTEDLAGSDVAKKSAELASAVSEGSPPPVPSKTEAEEVAPELPSKFVEPKAVHEKVDEGERGADPKMEGDAVMVDDNVPLDESAVMVPKPEEETAPTVHELEPSTETLIAAEPMSAREESVPVQASVQHETSVSTEIKPTADEAAESSAMGAKAPVTSDVESRETGHPGLVPAVVGAAAIAAGTETLRTYEDLKVDTKSAPHSPVAVAVVEPTPVEEFGSSAFSPVAAESVIEPIKEDDESVTPKADDEIDSHVVESVVPHVESIGEESLPTAEEPKASQTSTDEAPLTTAEAIESTREEDPVSSYPVEAVEANLPEEPPLPSAATIVENEQTTSPKASEVEVAPTGEISGVLTSQENVHLPMGTSKALNTEDADITITEPPEASPSPAKHEISMIEETAIETPVSEETLPGISDSAHLMSQETQPTDASMILKEVPLVSNEEASHADDIPVIEEHSLPEVLPVAEAAVEPSSEGDTLLVSETPGDASTIIRNNQMTPSEASEVEKAPAEDISEVPTSQENVPLPMGAREVSTTEDADIAVAEPPEESPSLSKHGISMIEEGAAETPPPEQTLPVVEGISDNGTQVTGASTILDEVPLVSNDDTSQTNDVSEKHSLPEVLPFVEAPALQLAAEETSTVQPSFEGDLPVVSETSGVFEHHSTAITASSKDESESPAVPENLAAIEESNPPEEEISAADAPVIEAIPSTTSDQIHQDAEIPAEIAAEQDLASEDPSTTNKVLAEDESLGLPSVTRTTSVVDDAAAHDLQSDQPIADVRQEGLAPTDAGIASEGVPTAVDNVGVPLAGIAEGPQPNIVETTAIDETSLENQAGGDPAGEEIRDGPSLVGSEKPAAEESSDLVKVDDPTVEGVSPVIYKAPVVQVPVVETASDSQEVPIAEVVSIPKVVVVDEGGEEAPQDMAADASATEDNETKTTEPISGDEEPSVVGTASQPETTIHDETPTGISSTAEDVANAEDVFIPKLPEGNVDVDSSILTDEKAVVPEESEAARSEPVLVTPAIPGIAPAIQVESVQGEEPKLDQEVELSSIQPTTFDTVERAAVPDVNQDTANVSPQAAEAMAPKETDLAVEASAVPESEHLQPPISEPLAEPFQQSASTIQDQPEVTESTPAQLERVDQLSESKPAASEEKEDSIKEKSAIPASVQTAPGLQVESVQEDEPVKRGQKQEQELPRTDSTPLDPTGETPTEAPAQSQANVESPADNVLAESDTRHAQPQDDSPALEEAALEDSIQTEPVAISQSGNEVVQPDETETVTADPEIQDAVSLESAVPAESKAERVDAEVKEPETEGSTEPVEAEAITPAISTSSAETNITPSNLEQIPEPELTSAAAVEGQDAVVASPPDNATIPSDVEPLVAKDEPVTSVGAAVTDETVEPTEDEVENVSEAAPVVEHQDTAVPSSESAAIPATVDHPSAEGATVAQEPDVESPTPSQDKTAPIDNAGINVPSIVDIESVSEPMSSAAPAAEGQEMATPLEPVEIGSSVIEDSVKIETTDVEHPDVSEEKLESGDKVVDTDIGHPSDPEPVTTPVEENAVPVSLETGLEPPVETRSSGIEALSDEKDEVVDEITPAASEKPISKPEPDEETAEMSSLEHIASNDQPSVVDDKAETRVIDAVDISLGKFEPTASPSAAHPEDLVTAAGNDAVPPSMDTSVELPIETRPSDTEVLSDEKVEALEDKGTPAAGEESISEAEPVAESQDGAETSSSEHIPSEQPSAVDDNAENQAIDTAEVHGDKLEPTADEDASVTPTANHEGIERKPVPEHDGLGTGPVREDIVPASVEPLAGEIFDARPVNVESLPDQKTELVEGDETTHVTSTAGIEPVSMSELVNAPAAEGPDAVAELPTSELGAVHTDDGSGAVEEKDEANGEGLYDEQVEPVVDEAIPIDSTGDAEHAPEHETAAASSEPLVVKDASEAQDTGTSAERIEAAETGILTNVEPVSEANHVGAASAESQDDAGTPSSEHVDIPNDAEPSVIEERGGTQTVNGERLPEKEVEPAEDEVIPVAPADKTEPTTASSGPGIEPLELKDNGEIQVNDVSDEQTERGKDEATDDSIAAKLESTISEPQTATVPVVEGLDTVELS